MKATPETPEATTKKVQQSESSCFTASHISKSVYNPAAQGGRGLQKTGLTAYSECKWCGEVGDNHRIIANVKK